MIGGANEGMLLPRGYDPMRLLLVSPANRSYVVMPSLGLGYLAAVSRKAGHEVRILSCLERRMSFKQFARFLRANPFDVIGFQVYSYDLNLMKRYLAVVRESAPGAVILAGGPHPSADPRGDPRLPGRSHRGLRR